MAEARRHPNSAQRPHRLSRAAFLNAAVDYRLRLPGLSFAEPPWPEGVEPTTVDEALRARHAHSQRNLEADLREAAIQRFRELGAPIPAVAPYPAWVAAVVEPEIDALRLHWSAVETPDATARPGAEDPAIPSYCIVAWWARLSCGSGETAAEFLNEDAPKNRNDEDEDENGRLRVYSRLDRHRVDRAARKARDLLVAACLRAARLGMNPQVVQPWVIADWIHTCRVANEIYRQAKRSPRLPRVTGRPLFEAIQKRKHFFEVYDIIDPHVPDQTSEIVARLRLLQAA